MAAAEPTVLEYRRRMDRRLDDAEQGLDNLVGRAGSVEDQLVTIRGEFAGMERRMDPMDNRLARIERRVGPIEA